MKQKFLSFISICLLVIFIISCGSGCTKRTSSGEKIEKISVWSENAHSKSVMTELISEFNRTTGKQEGIEVEYVVYGNDYGNTIEMAIASDQQPDIYKNAKTLLASVEKNEIYPLNKLPDMEEFLKGYEGRLKVRDQIINGDTYVVPTSISVYGLVYNKEMFKAAGIVDEKGEANPPKTWDELASYAKKLTNPAKKQYGIALPVKWGGFWNCEFYIPMCASFGRGAYDRASDKYDYSIYKQGLEVLLRIKKDGSFFPGADGLDNDTARAQFAEGRIGMNLAASWDVGVYNNQFKAKCDWGVAPIPVMNQNGEKYYPRCTGDNSMVVASTAEKKDPSKIATVFKFLNSSDVQRRLYEEGMMIPSDSKVIDGANETKINGWTEFANIGKTAKIYPNWISLKLEGVTMDSAFSNVWAESCTADEAIKSLNEGYNAAYEKSKKLYPADLEECYNIDLSQFDMRIKE